MSDYYEILGLDKAATKDDIKKAYRSLAKEHHPDVNGGDHSEEFTEIQSAYDVLSDPEDRAMFDEYGFSRKDGDLAKMQNMVTNIINECLRDGLEPEHLTDEIDGVITDDIDRFKEELEALQKAIDDLNKQKTAIKTKDGIKYDIVGDSIMSLMKHIEQEILVRNQDISTREKLLSLMDYYEKFGGMPEPVESDDEMMFQKYKL